MAAWTAGVSSAGGTPRKATLSAGRRRGVGRSRRRQPRALRIAENGSLRAPVIFIGIPEWLTAFDATAVKGI